MLNDVPKKYLKSAGPGDEALRCNSDPSLWGVWKLPDGSGTAAPFTHQMVPIRISAESRILLLTNVL